MGKFRDTFINEVSNIFGVPSIAGIGKHLSYDDSYLRFSFDFYGDEGKYRPHTSSCNIHVYEGNFKVSISGRSEFENEVRWAKDYKDSIISSKFFKKVQQIIKKNISLKDIGHDNGFIFETPITPKQTDELYKYMESVYSQLK